MAIIVVIVVAGAGAIAYMVLSGMNDEDGDDGDDVIKGQDTPEKAFQELVSGINAKDFDRHIGNTVLCYWDEVNLTVYRDNFNETFNNNTFTIIYSDMVRIDQNDISSGESMNLEYYCSDLNNTYGVNITDYAILHITWEIQSSNASVAQGPVQFYVLMVQVEGKWFFAQFIDESSWIEKSEWDGEVGGAGTPLEAFENVMMAINGQTFATYVKNSTTIFLNVDDINFVRSYWDSNIVARNVTIPSREVTLLTDEQVPALAREVIESSLPYKVINVVIEDYAILETNLTILPDNMLIFSPATSHALMLQIDGRWYFNEFILDETWDLEVVREELNVDDYLLYEYVDIGESLLMKVTSMTDTDYVFSVLYMHDSITEELGPVLVNKSNGIFWWQNGTHPDITAENYDGIFQAGTLYMGYPLCRGYTNLTEDGMESNTVYVGVNGIIYTFMRGIGPDDFNIALKETNIPWV